MNRYDLLAGIGVIIAAIGAFLIHPALLLVAMGYLALSVALARSS